MSTEATRLNLAIAGACERLGRAYASTPDVRLIVDAIADGSAPVCADPGEFAMVESIHQWAHIAGATAQAIARGIAGRAVWATSDGVVPA